MRIIVKGENTQSFTVPSDVTYLTEDGLDFLTETGDDLLIDITSIGNSPLYKTQAANNYFRTLAEGTFSIDELIDLVDESGVEIIDESGNDIVVFTGNTIKTIAFIDRG